MELDDEHSPAAAAAAASARKSPASKEDDVLLLEAVVAKGAGNWAPVLDYAHHNMHALTEVTVRCRVLAGLLMAPAESQDVGHALLAAQEQEDLVDLEGSATEQVQARSWSQPSATRAPGTRVRGDHSGARAEAVGTCQRSAQSSTL